MFDVGWGEATIILMLALLLFGPDKLAEFARMLGRLYGEYKAARRRLEIELLYGKEVIDRDYLKELAKNKLELSELNHNFVGLEDNNINKKLEERKKFE